ncbi:MAG: hypothetical protein ACI8RD_012912, partial [Bacillariaceae sp.]
LQFFEVSKLSSRCTVEKDAEDDNTDAEGLV